MENQDLTNKFGYAEMYEWSTVPIDKYRYGRFVQFDTNFPGKIRPYINDNTPVIGVSSINRNIPISDDTDHWWLENNFDEYGDIYMTNETLAVGIKRYDNNKEMSYIETSKYDHLIPIKNDKYDANKNYVKRSNRPEWCSVVLLGKCIVTDYGKCQPGSYCKPYASRYIEESGIVVPSNKGYYVIRRISDKTIMILLK